MACKIACSSSAVCGALIQSTQSSRTPASGRGVRSIRGIFTDGSRPRLFCPIRSNPPILIPVLQVELEKALRELPKIGTLVKDRGYRQIWRFENAGRAYYLKFYPKGGFRDGFRRLTRGSPAMWEFVRLQWLQKAKIPAPRGVAVLMGFQLGARKGDAVILEAIEPSVSLEEVLNDLELRGEPIPNHLQLAGEIRSIVKQLALAKFGHEDLHLGNFLLHDGRLYLLDAYAVQRDGLRMEHLMLLWHSVNRYATRTDLLRGWDELGPGGRPPRRNPVTSQLAGALLARATSDNRYFGTIGLQDWSGSFFKQEKLPRFWSNFSSMRFEESDWQTAIPLLLRRIEADDFKVIKRSPSGDVLSGEIEVGGRSLDVIIKRPRRRYWYRYLNEIGRGARARRAWYKAWKLIGRNLPTAWPLLLLEKRKFGYVTDAIVVFERVPGTTLSRADLDAMPPARREMLFRRLGRLLRKIEEFGFSHFDAKASNWIVRVDETRGPDPVLIDVDGIRQRRWVALGIRRLLRSMQDHKQYTASDSLKLCQGYAPFAPLAQNPPEEKPITTPAEFKT